MPVQTHEKETLIRVDSSDRQIGTTSQYAVAIHPKFQNVTGVGLQEFHGHISPYVIHQVETWVARIDIQPGPSPVDIIVEVQPGTYTLDEIYRMLMAGFYSYQSDNVRCAVDIFRHTQLGKTIIAGKLKDLNIGHYEIFSEPCYLNDLIGFPQGWLIDATTQPAIQSVNGVYNIIAPTSFMLAMEEFPSNVATSNQQAGKFHIPLTEDTYDPDTGAVRWAEEVQFEQYVDVLADSLSSLSVRILDPELGSPLQAMGEHQFVLKIKYIVSTH